MPLYTHLYICVHNSLSLSQIAVIKEGKEEQEGDIEEEQRKEERKKKEGVGQAIKALSQAFSLSILLFLQIGESCTYLVPLIMLFKH